MLSSLPYSLASINRCWLLSSLSLSSSLSSTIRSTFSLLRILWAFKRWCLLRLAGKTTERRYDTLTRPTKKKTTHNNNNNTHIHRAHNTTNCKMLIFPSSWMMCHFWCFAKGTEGIKENGIANTIMKESKLCTFQKQSRLVAFK